MITDCKLTSTGVTLYGAGGHCKVVVDILESLRLEVGQIIDDSPISDTFMGYPMHEGEENEEYKSAIITIGNCKIRKAIAQRINCKHFLTAIHPSAIISSNAEIGDGTVIVHGAIIQSSATVGNHCIINTKASVGHDVTINDFVHVASGATICGGSEVGECTWIGAGTVVKQGIKIGNNCMIGAGSVVVKDIPDNVIAFGNPCRVIKPNI